MVFYLLRNSVKKSLSESTSKYNVWRFFYCKKNGIVGVSIKAEVLKPKTVISGKESLELLYLLHIIRKERKEMYHQIHLCHWAVNKALQGIMRWNKKQALIICISQKNVCRSTLFSTAQKSAKLLGDTDSVLSVGKELYRAISYNINSSMLSLFKHGCNYQLCLRF